MTTKFDIVKLKAKAAMGSCEALFMLGYNYLFGIGGKAGQVPYKYISDSMGHSGGGDITSNYIGIYPLEKMLEYNSYLLNEDKPSENKPLDSKAALLSLLKGMTAEERAALMEEAAK